jgi:hypothetical protein
LITLLLMFGQQFSGINAVIFFSVTIFEAAKTTLNSFVESIIVAGTQVGVSTSLRSIYMITENPIARPHMTLGFFPIVLRDVARHDFHLSCK